jgi:prepilin-type N-terminal cleavage/methylation domain-containing protein
MKKTFSSKKSAFSLIELSIVLIIIGLLIAGITGGASLIKSSELRSIMGEARGYAVAVNSFFTQYDQYPGDASVRVGSASGFDGDRDNKIEYVNDVASPGVVMSEGLDAWFDLKDIGAIDLALTAITVANGATTAKVPVTDIPGSKIKGAGWAFDYHTASLQNVVVLTGTIEAWASATPKDLVNTAAPAATSDNLSTEIISAPDAFSIDSKIDDGKANSGNVQAINNASADATACTNRHLSPTSAPADYRVANGAKKTCALTFRVDVSS